MDKTHFFQTVADTVKRHGFSKNGIRFRKECDGLTAIIDLQKSSWSNSYYINVGFFLNDMVQGDPKKLKAYQGDITTRICDGTKTMADGKLVNAYCFDLDVPECNEDLVRGQLAKGLEEVVLPIASLAEARKIVELAAGKNWYEGYIVTASAMNYFSTNSFS